MASDWIQQGLLGRVRQQLAGREVHLVGGAVRDHLLGLASHDLDVVVNGTAEQTAAELAEALPARLVRLGGRRFAALRLVGADGIVDVWDRDGCSLEDELARRDLTINAIAVDLEDGSTHDPLGGRGDLELRRLRSCSPGSFRDDPLRVLRLARFAAALPRFEVESATLQRAAEASPALPAVASERRREELLRALSLEASELAVQVLDATGVAALLVGHSVEPGLTTQRLALARELRHRLTAGGAEEVDLAILHLSILITNADGGVDSLLERGWIVRSDARKLALVAEASPVPETPADRRWWLHLAGALWPTVLCHAVASDGGSAERLEVVSRLAREEGDAVFDPPPLLRGDEVGQLLEMEPGPDLGVLMRRLRRRQIEGGIDDREAAVEWLVSERRSSGAG